MSSARSSVTSHASSLLGGSAPGPPSSITRTPRWATRSPAGANRGEFWAPTPIVTSRIRPSRSGCIAGLPVSSLFPPCPDVGLAADPRAVSSEPGLALVVRVGERVEDKRGGETVREVRSEVGHPIRRRPLLGIGRSQDGGGNVASGHGRQPDGSASERDRYGPHAGPDQPV